MAGKHVYPQNGADPDLWLQQPPIHPGLRPDRAYSEGRQAAIEGGAGGDNPHPFGSPEALAWGEGFFAIFLSTPNTQLQTCWPDA
ncbi:MAG: hypothetical protein V3W44_06995 [Dehalococcoidales bacterium]